MKRTFSRDMEQDNSGNNIQENRRILRYQKIDAFQYIMSKNQLGDTVQGRLYYFFQSFFVRICFKFYFFLFKHNIKKFFVADLIPNRFL